jgi:nitrite reductase/ring-hydroxylating ferredoxin subunit
MSSDQVKVARIGELAEGRGKTVTAFGRAVALFKHAGCVYAIDDVCPHRGGPLGQGDVAGGAVECPLHGWSFELATGRMIGQPNVQIPTYPVQLDGEDVLLGPPTPRSQG